MLDKLRTELLDNGLVAFLGVLIGLLFGRRKENSESSKNEASAEALRTQIIIDLQKSLIEVQNGLEDMRRKNDEMFTSREAERNAREAERAAWRAEQVRITSEVREITTRNILLTDQVHAQDKSKFESEILFQARINELEKRIDGQGRKIETVEKKTGSLENKLPSHKP
jgi:hypothetical protein